MEHINKVELQGTVGKVYESVGCISFSLLTIETFTSKDDGILIRNTWHNIQTTKNEIDGQLKPYVEVNVIGKLVNTEYTAADGSSRTIPKIVASKVKVLD